MTLRETFSHLIGSYGYIFIWKVANPLYIDVRLVAHGHGPVPCPELSLKPKMMQDIRFAAFNVLLGERVDILLAVLCRFG